MCGEQDCHELCQILNSCIPYTTICKLFIEVLTSKGPSDDLSCLNAKSLLLSYNHRNSQFRSVMYLFFTKKIGLQIFSLNTTSFRLARKTFTEKHNMLIKPKANETANFLSALDTLQYLDHIANVFDNSHHPINYRYAPSTSSMIYYLYTVNKLQF